MISFYHREHRGAKRAFLLFFMPVFAFGGWAETVLSEMTLEEKIGQLFMAPACPMRKEDHWADWMRLMKECHVGNAILKQSDPASQVEFLNRLQAASKIPLLISGDMEWGLAMRISDTIAFPKQMTLGAIEDLGLIYEMGKEIGKEARAVGIHLCLAPVADVNCNPDNPIIHMRSFGENPDEVARRVSAYAKGLADGGAIACAKHFPGHGDTSVDSHVGLPVLPFERKRLDAVELVPFKRAIEERVGALMSAHLLVPCIDAEFPASLSSAVLRGVAREEMGFDGLIVSDALNMKALSDRYSPEEIAVFARRAGTDLLLYGAHLDVHVDFLLRAWIPRAFNALVQAYKRGDLDLQDLDESLLRILHAKEKLGTSPLLAADLKTPEALELKRRLFQEAVTLVGEPPYLQEGACYLSLGDNDVLGREFAHSFQAPLKLDRFAMQSLLEDLQKFSQVVIGLHQVQLKEENFGLSYELLELIDALSGRSIFCHFATPYALKLFSHQKTCLVGYENDPDAQRAVYRVLIGEEKPLGQLPVGR